MTDIDFTDLAQKVRKRLDEVFPEEEIASPGFGGPPVGLASSLTKAGKIAAALQWEVPRHAIRELAVELKRFHSRFSTDKQVALLIKVQLELCRYIGGCRTGIHPQALMLLLKSFHLMTRMAASPKTSTAARERATRQVLADYSALKDRLASSRSRDPETMGLDGAPIAKAVGRRTRAALHDGADSTDVLKNRAYYLVPVGHLEELTRFIEKEFEELHAAITRITPRSR